MTTHLEDAFALTVGQQTGRLSSHPNGAGRTFASLLMLGVFLAAMTTPGQAQTAAPVPASGAPDPQSMVLPDLNPAEWFDGKTGGTFGEKTVNAFTRSKRVAIAGFRVVFVTHNETSAITRGSSSRD